MAEWRKLVAGAVTDVENRFDQLVLRVSDRLGLDEPLMLRPFLGYGTTDTVTIKGRVLENDNILKATDRDGVWQNILNAYRQLESDEIPGATVQGVIGEVTATAVTNDEGYFDLHFTLPQPLDPHKLWHEVTLTLLDAPVSYEGEVVANGRILVPPANARFGVISDIDDTVLKSDATDYLSAARLLLLHNARTRLPFAGVAAFYQALQKGGSQQEDNPIFYVSSSPWNIFPLLTEFLEFQQIPLGPLFLKDYGISRDQLITSGHETHKLAQIETLFNTYPQLPFVLIGDSGQKDPEIYLEIVRRYPRRVRAIYIRDVTPMARDAQIDVLSQESEAAGVPLRLVADSYEAAQHAAAIGLIDGDTLPAIAQEVEEAARR